MTDGFARRNASRTDVRSRRSTADQVTPLSSRSLPEICARAEPRCAHACARSPRDVNRSSRWLPANPVAPVMSGTAATRVSAVTVLSLVVLAVFRVLVLDRPPPPLVLAIPVHSFREPLVKAFLWFPSKRLELRGVERIASVVSGAIRDRRDQGGRLSDQIEDAVGQIDVLDFVAATNVVDLAVRS